MPRVRELVEVTTGTAGLPERLVWRARPFRVTDMPTVLVGPCDWWEPFAVHEVSPGRVPLEISGWRFQATADDGETHVFDVARSPHGWQLVRVFD